VPKVCTEGKSPYGEARAREGNPKEGMEERKHRRLNWMDGWQEQATKKSLVECESLDNQSGKNVLFWEE